MRVILSNHFAELTQYGVPLNTVDVGGGLGVDYEGSGSRSACSMNYTVDKDDSALLP